MMVILNFIHQCQPTASHAKTAKAAHQAPTAVIVAFASHALVSGILLMTAPLMRLGASLACVCTRYLRPTLGQCATSSKNSCLGQHSGMVVMRRTI